MKKASGYVKKNKLNMAIESSWIFPMNSMVIWKLISHSYVSLPEGSQPSGMAMKNMDFYGF